MKDTEIILFIKKASLLDLTILMFLFLNQDYMKFYLGSIPKIIAKVLVIPFTLYIFVSGNRPMVYLIKSNGKAIGGFTISKYSRIETLALTNHPKLKRMAIRKLYAIFFKSRSSIECNFANLKGFTTNNKILKIAQYHKWKIVDAKKHVKIYNLGILKFSKFVDNKSTVANFGLSKLIPLKEIYL